MNPLLAQFISESRDLLEQASNGFLALEKNPADQSCIDEIFRAVHTIKGSSGLFEELATFTSLIHAAEDLLDQIRDGEIKLTRETTDLFLDTLDLVSAWLDSIEDNSWLPAKAERSSERLIAALREKLRASSKSKSIAENKTTKQNAVERAAWLAEFKPEALNEADNRAEKGETVFAVLYQPDENCFFSGEDPLNLVKQIPGVFALEIKPREAFAPLAELDYYRCILNFYVLATASREEIENVFRYVAEQTEIVEYVSAAVASKSEEPVEHGSREQAILLTILNEQKRALACDFSSLEQKETRIKSVVETLSRSLSFAGFDENLSKLSAAAAASLETSNFAPLAAFIEALENDLKSSSVEIKETPIAIENKTDDEPTQAAANSHAAKSLKVDAEKIDLLMDLIGELVVAKNGLPYLARRADKSFAVPELAREIKDQYSVIDRITDSLYQSIMQVRMMPVSFVFNRFPRLVRDLSQKLGKNIKLTLEGEETEADKNVIETLSDPLIHIVRNGIDHGVEMPEERLNAGKPVEANLRLRAFQESDRVVIEFEDDGRGIDAAKIKQKAYEKGLIDEEKLESLTDHEAIQLIFLPGFSMAEKVTDLSGRGVGMDVVRRAVSAAGGTVLLTSQKGAGTRFRIELPLTMAVTRVLIVGQGKENFGVPMDAIVETLRVARNTFRGLKKHEVMLWRDQLIPVKRLNDLLGLPQTFETASEFEEEAVLVIRQNGEHIGIVVEAFHERVDTILKPLDGIMSGFPGYSGTAILGDGRVLLILNFKELL